MEDPKLVLIGNSLTDGITHAISELSKPDAQTIYIVAALDPAPDPSMPDITAIIRELPKIALPEQRPEKIARPPRQKDNFCQRKISPSTGLERRRPAFQAKRGLR